MTDAVSVRTDGPVMVVTIDRPEVRNAVNRAAADRLVELLPGAVRRTLVTLAPGAPPG